MSKHHQLKCDEVLFNHILMSDKSTIRFMGQEQLKKGDTVTLSEVLMGRQTGETIERTITKVKGDAVTLENK